MIPLSTHSHLFEDQSPTRVSVVIPTYNNAHFVADAIRSILEQTYKDYEVIVVDDGSQDDTYEVVSRFGDQIRYIRQENQGLGGARNTGIRAAKGEFIGLLDADDQWQPTFLETMVSLINRHPKAAVCYCCAQGMDVEGRDLPQVYGTPVGEVNDIYNTLLRANFLIPSTIMIRRSVVMKVGLFEDTLRSIHGCEDWDLWLRLAPEYDFIGSSACLVRYRLHANTFSANPSAMQEAVRAVIENHFGPDDGDCQGWSWEKRRAYGGVYRYNLLTSLRHKDGWGSAVGFLQRAMRVDPTLAEDLDLFYEIALGKQPPGFRGTSHHLNLKDNALRINNLLSRALDPPGNPEWASLRRQAYGTAFFALGLVAYNTRQPSLSRHFFVRALRYRPDLWHETRVTGNLMKSFISRSILDTVKKFKPLLPDRLGSKRSVNS